MTLSQPLPDLAAQLRALLARIPSGRVTTYGSLARALGDRQAACWVGHYLLHHDHTADCNCHRVVRIDGAIGSYVDGGPAAKAQRLAAEGVVVLANVVDRVRYGFDRFVAETPLLALRELQHHAAQRVVIEAPTEMPTTVAGLDVSYTRDGRAVGGYALVDFSSGEHLWSKTIEQPVDFPYIRGLLAFRELPTLLSLVEAARAANRMADAYVVDGAGIAHPHHIGVASHFGVTVDLPTIGVTKKLLSGKVDLAGIQTDDPRPIHEGDREMGAAIRTRSPGDRVLYVSPGHRVDVPFATQVVSRLLRDHRLPEPLYWADRLSRQSAQQRGASI